MCVLPEDGPATRRGATAIFSTGNWHVRCYNLQPHWIVLTPYECMMRRHRLPSPSRGTLQLIVTHSKDGPWRIVSARKHVQSCKENTRRKLRKLEHKTVVNLKLIFNSNINLRAGVVSIEERAEKHAEAAAQSFFPRGFESVQSRRSTGSKVTEWDNELAILMQNLTNFLTI